ncbi:phosphoribulokinase/uridine kinase family protein [Verticillium dahliae VdLs.17]|uniref:Phosphoribulokinase/uridine kinase family protein n=1 Tax=Verticillium dahliae (strain VdLs.17 / ATCC MYA-4575 / FGSC 10137) TaxID=498257 RepID=G2XAH9_VERDV|nr:phosphoribulokinase/uridine kinase family protein [Verticillium dahliae VdLs.17]EGY15918.1 phosphoribulokinase/uridine kinase family protein [Verticillium dahliae VdLs.17]KAH6677963.1 phosphoribulokinase/uridine kinase [Verticillium dahliae]KAH6702183.1 phosphoribulokinase/uridine kinase [Verticillium dahliae]
MLDLSKNKNLGDNLAKTTAQLRLRAEHLLAEPSRNDPRQRVLIALAGVPGSGKSTVATTLLEDLNRHGIRHRFTILTIMLLQDGFHYSRHVLSSFNDPALAFRRRGAPFTFDATGFLEIVKKLKQMPVTGCGEHAMIIGAPSFDHAEMDPVPNSISLSSEARLVIIEGNYTLLNEAPWDQIADLVDDKWFVDVAEDVARLRLAARHLKAGIENTMELALLRADENDVPNGAYIRKNLIEPHVRIIN